MSSEIVVTQEMLERIARLKPRLRMKALSMIGQQEWQRCSDDVFYWFDESRHPVLGAYVFTKDPHPMYRCQICSKDELKKTLTYRASDRNKHLEMAHKVVSKSEGETRGYFLELDTTRPFPWHLPYMKPIVQTWLNEPIVIWEKSRDMTATWLTVALYTWDTLFHKGRENIFQSEDTTKTLDLVQRANFIYRNQPKFLRGVHKAVFGAGSSKSGKLSVPTLESVIMGFPQGADQIRQFHPSGIYTDETAFQVGAGDSFAAIKPAIQNGGRYTAVSSAYPSWFWHAARDRLDQIVESR